MPIFDPKNYERLRKQHRDDARSAIQRTQDVAYNDQAKQPELLLGRVLDFEPATGMCKVSTYSYFGEITAPIMLMNSSLCGVSYDGRYEEGYYTSQVKKYGNKKSEYVTEGMMFKPPVDALAVVLTTNSMLGKTGTTMFIIIGFLSFPQYEAVVGTPLRNATKESRLGEIGKVGQRGEKVKPHYKDYRDEVGWTESERKALAKELDNKFGENEEVFREVLPMISPDTWWQIRRGARTKETIGPTIFGTPVTLFGGKYRFIDRERLDAKRIEEKYDVNHTISDEVETTDVRSYTSESLIKIDEQGKIVIGADLEGTLVECFCSKESEYDNWERLDAGTFISLGLSAGVNYMEISSRDWMLTRFNRGVTKFSEYHRTHGHSHASRNRGSFGLPTKNFIFERDLKGKVGVDYYESNYHILDIGHLQIKADRLLLDIPPDKIYWKQFDGGIGILPGF